MLTTINSELIVIPTFLLCIIFYFRTLYYIYSQCEITRLAYSNNCFLAGLDYSRKIRAIETIIPYSVVW
ncbi:hypothetical protein ANCCAN_04965 [Ancylostoma caninum]|uniref:Uncharacterized protein n=1 Tax=Ancylostoma caninum TaxID=29170 RepID=A0A368GX99_ANCCA|nr:hypothetical protein ANCCAN_04965 [Ancylostoma caninum]